MLVSLAKSTIEDRYGEIKMSWGKFVALLGLCGALAVDSVEEGYPDGVAEIVETFGIIVEQAMGEWIRREGGGWEGFIRLNVYRAKVPPVPRTLFIIFMFLLVLYILYYLIVAVLTLILTKDPSTDFWRKWYTTLPEQAYCYPSAFPKFNRSFISLGGSCPKPSNPLQYMYALRIHRDSSMVL